MNFSWFDITRWNSSMPSSLHLIRSILLSANLKLLFTDHVTKRSEQSCLYNLGKSKQTENISYWCLYLLFVKVLKPTSEHFSTTLLHFHTTTTTSTVPLYTTTSYPESHLRYREERGPWVLGYSYSFPSLPLLSICILHFHILQHIRNQTTSSMPLLKSNFPNFL